MWTTLVSAGILWMLGGCGAAPLDSAPLDTTPVNRRQSRPLDIELLNAMLLEPDYPFLDMLSVLEETGIPSIEKREDGSVDPVVMELYTDANVTKLLETYLAKMYDLIPKNVKDGREARGLLSKLSFLTGLKLGGILSSSGSLAASQSFNFLGKVLNAALSVSYGNIGGLGGGGIQSGVGEIGSPIVGLQQLPIIQEDVPDEEKKRERPDNPNMASLSPSVAPARNVSPLEKVRKDFLKEHNQRVENFNENFDMKIRSRTGRPLDYKHNEVPAP